MMWEGKACSFMIPSEREAQQVLEHLDVLLPSLFDALHAPSERVVVEALSVQAAIATDDPTQFRTLMKELLDRCCPSSDLSCPPCKFLTRPP